MSARPFAPKPFDDTWTFPPFATLYVSRQAEPCSFSLTTTGSPGAKMSG